LAAPTALDDLLFGWYTPVVPDVEDLMFVRPSLFRAAALLLPLSACQCDDLGSIAPQGSLVPAVYELGPITIGQTCTATIGVRNKGNADLTVKEGSGLVDVDGDFKIKRAPTLVRLGGTEDLLVEYTADGTIGDLQSAGIELVTDDPDNDGKIKGTITAIVADGLASVAKTECDGQEPCASLDFGAVQLNGSGALLTVTVINDGTADMQVFEADITGDAAGAFVVESVRRGSSVLANFPAEPAIVPAGRTDDCGKKSDADNTLLVDVRYVPSALGANVGTLTISTNAIVGDELAVGLSGVGSDVGILLNPDFISFGEVPEGDTASETVLVQNVGTQAARVDTSCIDLENDGVCEGNCTGDAEDAVLSGTLGCDVTTASDGDETFYFELSATDASVGGGDERKIIVTWSPVAGATTIPATAVLALHSNILGDRIYTVPVRGGALGALSYATSSDDVCPGGAAGFLCVEAEGTLANTMSWTGSMTIEITNTGAASVTIAGIDFEDGSPPTIADDFTIGALSSTTLAPDASATFDVDYANNDASQEDYINLTVTHDGEGGATTIPIAVVPPPA
jgi:hypothetical protein